jgi:hypothetical protein
MRGTTSLPFGIQVGPVDLPLLISVAELRPHVVAGVLRVHQADGVEIDQRYAQQLPKEPL